MFQSKLINLLKSEYPIIYSIHLLMNGKYAISRMQCYLYTILLNRYNYLMFTSSRFEALYYNMIEHFHITASSFDAIEFISLCSNNGIVME